ncbi:MAG: hypothetical protein WA517_20430 [Candidatus Acidiferrum sp.]
MKPPEMFTLKGSPERIEAGVTLYFHYPCFDGLISCVLASEFLERNQQWNIARFCPVNYHYRDSWLAMELQTPSAVVDFLYHPQARFWADHHGTTFVTEKARLQFELHKKNSFLLFDSDARSCASLLWSRFDGSLGEERFAQMVFWADKIDSASYTSVEEAIFGDAPALRINFTLLLRNDLDYCRLLVQELRSKTLHEVSALPEIQEKVSEVRRRTAAGLKHLEKHIRLEEGNIAAFDIETNPDEIVSRYAPYYFFEGAHYSISVVRSANAARITAMRNPWRSFESIPLGKVFERFGGGGHQRVGAVNLTAEQSHRIPEIVAQVSSEMRKSAAVERVVA